MRERERRSLREEQEARASWSASHGLAAKVHERWTRTTNQTERAPVIQMQSQGTRGWSLAPDLGSRRLVRRHVVSHDDEEYTRKKSVGAARSEQAGLQPAWAHDTKGTARRHVRLPGGDARK